MTHAFHRTCGTALAIACLLPAVADAARNSLGVHAVVAHQGANVRRAAQDGSRTSQYIGHLAHGDRFTVTRHDGAFCFGHAAGHVNRDGWVLCGALSK
ncbi:MAG: hypothetical protein QM679_13190 [Patulibacter sp.]